MGFDGYSINLWTFFFWRGFWTSMGQSIWVTSDFWPPTVLTTRSGTRPTRRTRRMRRSTIDCSRRCRCWRRNGWPYFGQMEHRRSWDSAGFNSISGKLFNHSKTHRVKHSTSPGFIPLDWSSSNFHHEYPWIIDHWSLVFFYPSFSKRIPTDIRVHICGMETINQMKSSLGLMRLFCVRKMVCKWWIFRIYSYLVGVLKW